MLGYSDMFLADCTHIGFSPPALSGAASILKSGSRVPESRTLEALVFKDSDASKKAWIKIHQKNALKGLDTLSGDIAAMHGMAEGKAKQKAMDKISLKSNHLEKKFLENGGDPATFLDHQMAAYNKAATPQPPTAPQTDLPSNTTPTPTATPKAPPSAIQATPKWDNPNGTADDQIAHAKEQNHKLGTAYYLSREKNGKDHPITQGVYSEWQKSKEYLKADNGFDSGGAAIKSKEAASKQLQAEKSQAAQAVKAKTKSMDDLSSDAYNLAYHKALNPNSHESQQAEDKSLNSQLIAQIDGHSEKDILDTLKSAKAKAEKAAAGHVAMKSVLDGSSASAVKYHDKVTFEDLSMHSSSFTKDPYAVTARAITDKLTEEQKNALSAYGGSGYTEQNKAVVAGKVSKNAEIMKKIMDNSSLPVDAKLRRNMAQKWFWKSLGVSPESMDSLSDADMKSHVGKVFVESAFSSTSKDPTFSAAFGKTASHSGKLKLNIRAPKGSQALDISYQVSNHGEAEIVLNRGATYVIRDIRRMSGSGFKYEADVDLIGFKSPN